MPQIQLPLDQEPGNGLVCEDCEDERDVAYSIKLEGYYCTPCTRNNLNGLYATR